MAGIPICDREAIILDVFLRHARTRRARIQVEIAQLEYLRPRIRGVGLDMDQQVGGMARGRGPGETASELMARKLDGRLKELQKALRKLETSGSTQRRQRGACRRIVLVGYTNAGKTSLMNALTASDLTARDTCSTNWTALLPSPMTTISRAGAKAIRGPYSARETCARSLISKRRSCERCAAKRSSSRFRALHGHGHPGAHLRQVSGDGQHRNERGFDSPDPWASLGDLSNPKPSRGDEIMKTLVEVSGATIATPSGRPLFEGLSLRLSRERVALIGRNGVGKSTLLAVLAGATEARSGRVKTWSKPHFVPQALSATTTDRETGACARALSHGELRKLALVEAKSSEAEILLLDEPSEDLDEAAVSWLRGWLKKWPGCLVAASHDRWLLADFQHFFIASESGCRYFFGTLTELDAEVEREHQETQQRCREPRRIWRSCWWLISSRSRSPSAPCARSARESGRARRSFACFDARPRSNCSSSTSRLTAWTSSVNER
jgi:energy-coupling factor transporter ATP-binding protein EcfA2